MQFVTADKNGFISEPITRRVYSHTINSQTGIRAARAVEEYRKRCAHRNITWKDMEFNGDLSIRDSVQWFCDKSPVSLRAGALSFHPTHMMALNFNEKRLPDEIIENRTLVVSFQVFYDSSNVDEALPSLIPFQKISGRAGTLQSLHGRVKWALEMCF